ncbi:hypothetical protein BC826DRAFT_1149386 [Russula brevipes]|nr:hypothetical protein BC826DRAFT_1149386 [Russula brevipes]
MPTVPTLKDSPTAQQISTTLDSAISASQRLIKDSPEAIKELRATFLNFYAHPTFALVLGIPTQHPSNPTAIQEQLSNIKTQLQALLKAVEDKPAPSEVAKGHPTPAPPAAVVKNTPPNTYANKAKQEPRPTLVVDFLGNPPDQNGRMSGHSLCEDVNKHLSTTKVYTAVQVSAARWTSKGNLVLTAAHTVTQQQLNFASAYIKKVIGTSLDRHAPHLKLTEPIIRATVKWSKITINGVPTGVSETRGPHTPEECHAALLADNPQYAQLTITQKPSWVRTPASYTPSSSSSLVFAFEDPDGSKKATLLNSKCVYLFGARATLRKWKTPTQTTPAQDNNMTTQTKSPTDSEPSPQNPSAPPASTSQTCPPITSTGPTHQPPAPANSPRRSLRNRIPPVSSRQKSHAQAN